MADYTTVEISALKDTLCAQQNLLQKLYNELDAEREASASAASEALSVILRLQAEKAAVKLEAEQYKRLSEEKMSHAEESLAIIKDIIYQKEMEISSLDCQVQAYRYKLLSMGASVDNCIGETKVCDEVLQENENLGGETSFQGGRRTFGPNSFKYMDAVNESGENLIMKIVEEKKGREMYDRSPEQTDDSISSYWEQIRKLDVRVKEIAGANYANSRSETCSPSLSSRRSSGNLCDLSNSANLRVETRSPSPQNKVTVLNKDNEFDANLLKNGVAVDFPCSPNVHDVFEVPQIDRNLSPCEEEVENDTAKCLVRKDVVHPEAADEKLYATDESDWLKKVLEITHREKQLSEPSDSASSIQCRLAVVENRIGISESQHGLYPLNGTSEIIEIERPTESTNREEELKLLNEIKEQINSLHEEISSWKVKTKKSPKRDEPSLCVLQEAMIYFWL